MANEKNDDKMKNTGKITEERLKAIPFLAGKRVQAILDHVQIHGEPSTLEEYMKIPQIGAEIAQQLYEHFDGDNRQDSKKAAG